MKEIKNFFTRKNAIIIFAVILSVVVAIFSAILVIHKFSLHKGDKENGSYESVIESEVTDTSESENQSIEQNPETVTSQPSASTNQVQSQKPLSPEEIAMREEIAKVSDTTIEFPYTRQIEFNGIKYNAVYEKLKNSPRLDVYRIVYKTESCDTFEYDLLTGKLYDVEIESLSNVVAENKISKEKAQTIAQNYYNNAGFNGYTFDECMDRDYGYAIRFVAPKYKGYKTDDCIVIRVNNMGDIWYITIPDFHYDNLDYNIDHAKVQEKMQLPLHQGDKPTTARLVCVKGKVYFLISPVNSNNIPYYAIEEFLED